MNTPEIEELMQQALAALRRGEDVRAVAIADQLAAAAPDNPLVRAIRAQALLSGEDAEAAMEEARRAVELDVRNAMAHLVLGLAAWRAERLTLAQRSLSEAIRLSPGNPRPLVEYAWFMAQERGPRLAEEAAQHALRADADSSTAWAALGVAQYRLHRLQDAETSLRRALQLDPNDIYAQSAMVVLLQDLRKDDKAVALAKLLEESRGAEDFVAAVRNEAKQRQIAKMLVERKALPEVRDRQPARRWWAWLIASAVMCAGLCLVVQPEGPLLIVLCTLAVVVPCVLLWCLRRILE